MQVCVIFITYVRSIVSRKDRRKYEQDLASVIKKAKIDMQDWFNALGEQPSQLEIIAWQSGYLAGVNRATANVDKIKQPDHASAS
jgi:hypothetical protein